MEWVVDDFGVCHMATDWTLSLEHVNTYCGLRLRGDRQTTPEQPDGPVCDGCQPMVDMEVAVRAAAEEAVRRLALE